MSLCWPVWQTHSSLDILSSSHWSITNTAEIHSQRGCFCVDLPVGIWRTYSKALHIKNISEVRVLVYKKIQIQRFNDLNKKLVMAIWSSKCDHRDQTRLKTTETCMYASVCVRRVAKQTAGPRERVYDEEAWRVSRGNVCLFISSLGAVRYRGMAALQGQYFTLACAR